MRTMALLCGLLAALPALAGVSVPSPPWQSTNGVCLEVRSDSAAGVQIIGTRSDGSTIATIRVSWEAGGRNPSLRMSPLVQGADIARFSDGGVSAGMHRAHVWFPTGTASGSGPVTFRVEVLDGSSVVATYTLDGSEPTQPCPAAP